MMWDGEISMTPSRIPTPPPTKPKPDLAFDNTDWVKLYAILEEAHTMAKHSYYTRESTHLVHFFGRMDEIHTLINKVANLFEEPTPPVLRPYSEDAEPEIDYTLNNRDWLNIFSIVDEAHSITLTQYNKQQSVTNFWGRRDELNTLRVKILNLFEGTK